MTQSGNRRLKLETLENRQLLTSLPLASGFADSPQTSQVSTFDNPDYGMTTGDPSVAEAAIAIPAYQDYTVRSKVSEGL